MSAERKELQAALCHYIGDTLIYVSRVRDFCEKSQRWVLSRERELKKMTDIKAQVTADSRRAELETELAGVLKDTLGGLEELDSFLDAVENLAVTSLHVFTPENRALRLPEGIGPEDVQLVITAARAICSLLIELKRDASSFFLAKLQNVEVLSYQLNEYIKTTQEICGMLEKSSLCDFTLEKDDESLVDLDADLSQDDVQMMLSQINELDEIRMNQSFRTVFLFQGKYSCFLSEFEKLQAGMLQSLNELEENAVELDRMSKGAKISSVAGSSVGAVGGVLSIVGLALTPVTAGLSLALTMTGLGLGITSGVNSAVTTATEIGVNLKHQKKVGEIFQSFMEDVKSLQDCLDQVTPRETAPKDVVLGVGKVLAKGCETKFLQFIRARSALWRSEMDSWQKIYDFLREGLQTSERNEDVLKTPFYPERETGKKISFDEVDEKEKINEKKSCV